MSTEANKRRALGRAAMQDAILRLNDLDMALARMREHIDELAEYPDAIEDVRSFLAVADHESANARQSLAAAVARLDSADDRRRDK